MSTRQAANIGMVIFAVGLLPVLLGFYSHRRCESRLKTVASPVGARPSVEATAPCSAPYRDAFITVEASDESGLDSLEIIDEGRGQGMSLQLLKAKPMLTFRGTYKLADLFEDLALRSSTSADFTVVVKNIKHEESKVTTTIQLR
jgi:hypothetical protein